MLSVIEQAAGDGSVEMTFATLMADHHFGRQSISASLKMLDRLGLIDVSRGRLGNCYSPSTRWRTILDAAQAAALARQARAIMPTRRFEARREPPQPVKVIEPVEPVQFMERKPSMPTLAWLGR